MNKAIEELIKSNEPREKINQIRADYYSNKYIKYIEGISKALRENVLSKNNALSLLKDLYGDLKEEKEILLHYKDRLSNEPQFSLIIIDLTNTISRCRLSINTIEAEKTNMTTEKKNKELNKGNVRVEPINWYGNRESLHYLITTLGKKNFIKIKNTSEEIIDEHFIVEGSIPSKINPTRIIWLSDIKFLPYLFKKLIENNYVTVHGKKHEILTNHFVKRNGNPLKTNSLSSSLSMLLNNTIKKVPEVSLLNSIVEGIQSKY